MASVQETLRKREEEDETDLAVANSKLCACIARIRKAPMGSGERRTEEAKAISLLREMKACEQRAASSRARRAQLSGAARAMADAESTAALASALRSAPRIDADALAEDLRKIQEQSRELDRMMERSFDVPDGLDDETLTARLAELSAEGYDAPRLPDLPPVPAGEAPPRISPASVPLHSK